MNKIKKTGALIAIGTALFTVLFVIGSPATVKAAVKTYQVAVSTDSKPLSYKQNGKLTGYEVEVLKAIDKELPNVKFKYHAVSQSAELVGLDSGKYDLASNGFYKNSEREKKYVFGDENDGLSLVKVYYNKAQFSKAPTDLDDLVGKVLAPVNANGGMYNLLTTWNNTHSDKQVTIKTTSGIPMQQLLNGVNTGKYDALIDPSNLSEADIIKQKKLTNVKTSKPVRAFPTYFLFTKKNKALAGQVDEALKKLKSDGTLKKYSIKYFGENVFNYKVKEN